VGGRHNKEKQKTNNEVQQKNERKRGQKLTVIACEPRFKGENIEWGHQICFFNSVNQNEHK